MKDLPLIPVLLLLCIVVGSIGGVIFFGIYSVYALVGLLLFIFIFFDIYHGLYLILLAMPLLVGEGAGVNFFEIGFLALVASWYIGWLLLVPLLKGKRNDFNWFPLFKPTVAMIVIFAIAMMTGVANGAPLMDAFRDMSAYIGYFILLPVLGMVNTREKAGKIMIFLAIIGLPGFLVKMYLRWTMKFGIEREGGVFWSRFSDFNEYFGPFIGCLWPAILLQVKSRIKLFALAALVMVIFLKFFSGYRSELLSVALMTIWAMFLVLLVEKGERKLSIIMPFVILVIFSFLVMAAVRGNITFPGSGKISQLYSKLVSKEELSSDTSIEGRIVEAEAAMEAFKEKPVLGQGFGHRISFYWRYGSWYEESFKHHIWVPEMLRKFGIIGSLVWVWFFFSALKYAFLRAKHSQDAIAKVVSLGTFIWIATYLIPGIGHFGERAFTFIFGVVMGVLPALTGDYGYPEKKVVR